MLTSNNRDEVSATYYSKALRILIPILDGPIEELDENILAAIVVLRAFEELSGMKYSRN